MPSAEDPNQLVPTSSQTPAIRPPQPGIQRRAIQHPPATASVKSVSGVLSDIGDNAVTSRAEEILSVTDEDMTWQERPSLVLLIPRFLKYAVLMAVVIFLCSVVDRYAGPSLQQAAETQGARLNSTLQEHDTKAKKTAAKHVKAKVDHAQPPLDGSADDDPAADAVEKPHEARLLVDIQYAFGCLYLMLFTAYLLRLLTTKYNASSQRLIVEEGVLHSVNRPYELHQLSDAVISKPLIPRLFGVGNLCIVKPPINLIGLRNPEYVRDLIRQGGQLEAQRADKIRWR